jgi:possible ADP-ribosyl-[dinitrogen reductase] hydrolase
MSRCAGILYGQLIGDSLGSLVEFQSAAEIAAAYPDGVRELRDGGVFRLSAGQPTDDSEMAMAMARSIIRMGGYDAQDVLDSYRRWAASDPFDIGITCANALLHQYINPDSQANGALMRLSPLAILGMNLPEDTLADLAELDCRMTHTHPLCITINRIVAVALARAAAQELTASAFIDVLLDLAPPELRVFIEQSTERPLVSEHIGWVKLAFSYAVYELATGTDFEESLVRTIGRGGDTDTNAAIVGAVLGGVYGSEGIPQRWRDTVEKCTPGPGTLRPRPEEYWPPANVEDMAASLRQCGE